MSGRCQANLCAAAGRILFTESGTFTVPAGVNLVHVLVVGGGGGGANGNQTGGGSGLVASETIAVSPGALIPVTVGAGGLGAEGNLYGSGINGNTTGGMSSFGAFVSANGGSISRTVNGPAAHGGSGAGGGCNDPNLIGGAGGTNGTKGGDCTSVGGAGQGSFTPHFARFARALITPGSGGAGGTSFTSGGGGGGGVVIDGAGPSGQPGAHAASGKGGRGFGGGGGGGGNHVGVQERVAGGNGAPGVVYVEY